MNVKITPAALGGSIRAISSKSDAHRILICSALADKPTKIKLGAVSKDIKATLSCLEALGCRIDFIDNDTLVITPVWENIKYDTQIDCDESGSTLRFLLPVIASLGITSHISGKGRLPKRPLSPLKEELSAHGVKFSGEQLPLCISGKLESGKFSLAGNVSSQFITGLLFALPLANKDSEIVLTSKIESKGYIDMTVSTLRRFGIEIEESENSYKVKGCQKYISPQTINENIKDGTKETINEAVSEAINVDGDWSNAAFWLVAGAIARINSEGITVAGLDMKSCQGDKEIVNILRKFGANVHVDGSSVSIKKGKLIATDIDASQIPDLVPIIAVLASVSSGTTKIYGAKRLRIKESDRLSSVCQLIAGLGGDITERDEGLIIKGRERLIGGRVDSCSDHRIAMAAAIASTVCENTVMIENAQAVEKSYLNFWSDFKMLGGKFNVI
ncbi:MAG: 3-phosphoshikimate 1-carboxyvinyltransferase [Clostridia bacterium]|nr:3-phosphoshikimate 1-carboxyvinyltransferase [Clostridia bacterium]MDD4048543.1 3-phosphoshikimate 1-carboxyvinyltransferase [Clostridia bacterium]